MSKDVTTTVLVSPLESIFAAAVWEPPLPQEQLGEFSEMSWRKNIDVLLASNPLMLHIWDTPKSSAELAGLTEDDCDCVVCEMRKEGTVTRCRECNKYTPDDGLCRECYSSLVTKRAMQLERDRVLKIVADELDGKEPIALIRIVHRVQEWENSTP